MRAPPLAALLAASLVTSPTCLLVRASPNALALSQPAPALVGRFPHVDRQQESKEEEVEHAHVHDEDAELKPPPSHDGGNNHMHFSGSPMTELNETFILMHHKPSPPSYGTHDFEDPDVHNTYPGLMLLHALFLISAFFVVLPISIALRSVKHHLRVLAVVAFYAQCALGVAASALYRKLTPNLYEGAVHAKQGYFVLLIGLVLTTANALPTLQRIYRYALNVRAREQDFSLGSVWRIISGSRPELDYGALGLGHEYTGLIAEDSEEVEMGPQDLRLHDLPRRRESGGDRTLRCANNMRELPRHHRHRSSDWRASVASGSVSPRVSHHSDDSLHEVAATRSEKNHPGNAARWQCIGRIAFATTERVLVFLGYMQAITGLVTYSGICRDSYVNVCLAHLIKGGIFWCYGLVTFARFLGSFADVGWSWNLAPRPDGNNSLVSAEFVECLVIFIYGITNTWMERFGAAPGSPYTSKQIQHIGIAVMFWFAGLVGMGVESRRIRTWFSAPVSAEYTARSTVPEAAPVPPSSYRASFNPFPALVIGVTGAAMSAHAQAYVFQMQIHVLWGGLLAAFAVLRWLTYFFVWLGPPKSVLPGRPPTEALASFFLACGGLMFQFSTEEITIAAMRRGHADQMMFLNVAVALTCIAFCWVLAVVAFKAWLKMTTASTSSNRYPGAIVA